ncbi:Aste57867_11133 [Aphanomyces stellatus]|uniref:Aste57867_11133 protein n=1 Tax=Aphanomyces stellatus TaxID=120398 RepID=A0A485KU05_9STRA|nr:hypothetical protein As57867_011091 [Aphanomyces stellatus]VFT88000.1 Aste57867_11133 [Aphanomyces stellatus]
MQVPWLWISLLSLAVASPACPYAELPSFATNVCAWDKTQCQNNSLTGPCVLDKTTCNIVRNVTCNAYGSYADVNASWTGLTFDSCKTTSRGVKASIEMFDLPDRFSYLSFSCTPLVFAATQHWPTNLTYLYLQNAALATIPKVPDNLTALGLWGNYLDDNIELTKIPKSLTYLDIGGNDYTKLTNLDWSSLKYVHIGNNNITRLENVSFGKSLITLDLTNLTITSWIMTNDTFNNLNSAVHMPEHPQLDDLYQGNMVTAGYMVNGTTIRSNEDECMRLQGDVKALWNDTIASRFSANRKSFFTVCVLRDPSAKAALGTGTIVGIALGIAAAIGLVFFFILRRRQRQSKQELDEMRDLYQMTQTPGLSQGEEDGLNMQELTLCRLDQNDLKLQRKLGSGAFADVWLATFQGESVAVKKMHSSKVTVNQLHSFIDEIKLMATFDSPYIVKLIGAAWTRPSDVKCVMELMEGGDLKDFLDRHNADEFTWNDKYKHIHSIVEGLVYLHSLSIIHRDIKSRNILLDPKKGTKLTDFGISKEDMQATMTMGVGTFRWMAPEVIQDKDYTVAADIYSFGMILSEFDTHHIPYEELKNPTNGQPVSDSAIMVKVVAGTIKPSFTGSCPEWISDMALQCLSYNPDDRPTAMQLSNIVRLKLKEFSGGRQSL